MGSCLPSAYCWIYEHFPSVDEAITTEDYHERKPHAYRWTFAKSLLVLTYRKRLSTDMHYGNQRPVREFELISCFFGHIRWGPAVVIHRPERVARQFEHVQTIPPHSLSSRLYLEDIDDKWMHFYENLAPVGQICVVPGQCASDYMDWFYMILHPFMRPAHPGDPVRHPPVMQDDTYVEPDMPQ
ncbi:hypothetical protein GmHk_07G019024 [Glycine max]|nr:hypothetical protein GmHk_07G019024 [Glycine max]